MNPAKCNEYDYINFLIASQRYYSCMEASRVQPQRNPAIAHDALTRLLHRLEPNSNSLWEEAQHYVDKPNGILIVDDSTLDKLDAKQIELVTRHWSGKHHQVVLGINLITLLWTEGDSHIPCDYRIYDKNNEGRSKNAHCRALLREAKNRGLSPTHVVFDSWYSGLDNLKTIRQLGWEWLTRFKSNRQVNPDQTGNRAISDIEIGPTGRVVHLKGYGLVKVFKIVAKNGDIAYWASSHLEMNPLERLK